MSWKPTDGLRRAEYLVHELCTEASAADSVIHPLYRWRMIEVISKALDQALADGAEHDALDKVVGNGYGAEWLAKAELKPEGTPVSDMVQRHVDYMADRVVEANEEGPGSYLDHLKPIPNEIVAKNILTPEQAKEIAEKADATVSEPKKKRGRPKGSKAKKAKPAKAKAAKEPNGSSSDNPNVELHAGQPETPAKAPTVEASEIAATEFGAPA